MPRQPKHSLNRYAKPTDEQIRACRPLAKTIAIKGTDAGICGIMDCICQSQKLVGHIVDLNAQAFARSPEAMVIENLGWVNAFTESLGQSGVRNAPTTAHRAYFAAYHLHTLGTYFEEDSILTDVIDRFSGKVSWSHVMNLVPILDIDVPVIPTRLCTVRNVPTDSYLEYALSDPGRSGHVVETCKLIANLRRNRKTVLRVLETVSNQGLSPKQMLLRLKTLTRDRSRVGN